MTIGAIDISFLVASMLASLAIGLYHGLKGLKATPDEYFLGGRAMSPLPLAMSLVVGTISAITVMGNAGEMYVHGTQLWLMDLGVMIGMIIVTRCFIPVFYPLSMVSLYQYIQLRFSCGFLHKVTVLLIVTGGFIFMGFLLYPPSIILMKFTHLSITLNIIIMGCIGTIYSAFGGVKAVVYADVFQSVVMLVGVLAVVIQGAIQVGGLTAAWEIALQGGRIEFFNLSFDPYQRHSFWLVTTYGVFFAFYTYGVHQGQTQRAFSTGSLKKAQRVIIYSMIGLVTLKSLINLSGIVIYANYAQCDPLTYGNKKQNSAIIVAVYVFQHLTKIPGLGGLFIAAITSAALSSVSTNLNSMAALVWEDFLKDSTCLKNWDEIKVARLQKLIVFFQGFVGIGLALFISYFHSFLHAVLQITGAVGGPMVGLFFIALYFPWVKAKGAKYGLCVSIVVSLLVVIGQISTQEQPAYLPMLHVGCPSPQFTENNATADAGNITTSAALEHNSTVVLALPEESTNQSFLYDQPRGQGFFGLSYCLNYCWGVLCCLTTALLITVITGSNTPEEVDEKLISPTVWRWFKEGKPYLLTGRSSTPEKCEMKEKQTYEDAEPDEIERL